MVERSSDSGNCYDDGVCRKQVTMQSEAIEFLSAVLIYSRNPARLAAFYRDVLGVSLEEERHGTEPVHYGCELGDVHFAIHPNEDGLEETAREQRFRLAFTVFSTIALLERLKSWGISPLYPPKKTGFAVFTAVHDPDGNYVELTELSDSWFEHLKSRKKGGADVVTRWESRRMK
jgi:catechol 2,3-dioxygenase-like lactoylglutathione lyase family enzyme